MKKLIMISSFIMASAMLTTGVFAAEIVTNGTATVTAAPDEVTVNLGVTIKGDTSSEAIETNNAITNDIYDYLYSIGLTNDDVKTDYFSVYPDYSYTDGGQAVENGYVAYNSVEVTLDDFSLLSDVITESTGLGATEISDISYDLSNKDEHYNQALQNAVKSAISRGQTIGSAMGDTDLAVTSVVENSSNTDYNESASYSLDVAYDGAGNSSDIPVSPEEISITARVTVTME